MDRLRVTDLLTRDEIASLSRASDLGGAWGVVGTWAIIAGAFALLARFPHPAVFVLVVVVLGGRQLALAVLMHEAAHRSLFRTRWLNDVAADWLCARPVWTCVTRYRQHHVAHHAHTGTERDPDLALALDHPISRASLARKIARDLLFVSGLKRALGLLLMDLDVLDYDVSGTSRRRAGEPPSLAMRLLHLSRRTGGVLVVNAALFGILWAAGHAWTYLAWVVAWLTTYGLFLRIRALAEHACTERSSHPLRNTRTTAANWLARATVAPLNVSFHLEHHLLVAVPWYRLPRMHRLLRERGALAEAMTAPGYLAVLRTVTASLSEIHARSLVPHLPRRPLDDCVPCRRVYPGGCAVSH